MGITKAQAAKAKKDLKAGKEFDDAVYDAFVEYFTDGDEMPYGTKKARSGDPYNWTADKLGSMPDAEVEELIDTLTEENFGKITDIFNSSLNESSGFRESQLHKNLNNLLDTVERLVRITSDTSVTMKMVKEFGGDDKLLKNVNKTLTKSLDDLEDVLKSVYSNAE